MNEYLCHNKKFRNVLLKYLFCRTEVSCLIVMFQLEHDLALLQQNDSGKVAAWLTGACISEMYRLYFAIAGITVKVCFNLAGHTGEII